MNSINNSINHAFKLKWNLSTGGRSTTAAVILAGTVAMGVFGLLGSSGMSGLLIGGGFCALGGLPLLLDTAWMVSLVKNRLNSSSEIELEEFEAFPDTKKLQLPEQPQLLIYKGTLPTKDATIKYWLKFNKNKSHDQLIAAAHSIKDRALLRKYIDEALGEAKIDGDYFLATLFQCRAARLELEEQGIVNPFDFENDIVVPVCETGTGRSAIIYGILKLMYPELRMLAPYGVKGGIDPHHKKAWINRTEKTPSTDFANTYKGSFGFSVPNPLGTDAANQIGFDFNSDEWSSIADILKKKDRDYFERQLIEQNQYTQKQETLENWFTKNVFTDPQKGNMIFVPVNLESKKLLSQRIPEAKNIAPIGLDLTPHFDFENTIFYIQYYLREKAQQ